MRKLTLLKELSKLPSSDKRTVRVRGCRVGTIRRGTATGVGEFQGGPKFCFEKSLSRLVRKKNPERKLTRISYLKRNLKLQW